ENCRIIDTYQEADAVLYHGPDFHGYNQHITSKQIAVFWVLESPVNYRPNRINWTMTYRLDSDILLPYGVIRKAEGPIQVDYEQLWNEKKASTVWLISNCGHNNARIQLANALQQGGLNIDIFGRCGKPTPNNCDGTSKQSDKCVAELFRPYKFAISFENSLCPNYITEKFYELLEDRYTVPIVMQRSITRKNLQAPNNSFIAVDDFKNLADLVNYIHTVENSKEEYLKYQSWREHYTVKSAYFSIEETGFCALCKKLMANNFTTKYYENMSSWHSPNTCEQPQDGFAKKYLDLVTALPL
uniref:Fucosyltransferase n=1 Tax=Syphacia muris TaxID=451379 RepID=A0A0N5AAQ1_9BILA